MTSLVRPGEAIEGGSLSGSARKVPINRGRVEYRGQRCFRYIADFDVRARVERALAGDAERLEPTAATSVGDELICSKAIIHTMDKRPSHSLQHRTSTHKANFITFSRQTAARVETAHAEIAQAQSGREPRPLPEP